MAGIIFLRTARFEEVRAFYTETIGMSVWLEQPDVAILRHGNLLVGFHQQPEADLDGLITFFYETRAEVDQMHARLRDVATSEPLASRERRTAPLCRPFSPAAHRHAPRRPCRNTSGSPLLRPRS
jgi:catechol 2,3-dioxygenase-like lactoylglutathione lyase family enzyme